MTSKYVKIAAIIGLLGSSAAVFASQACCGDIACCIEQLLCCL